MQIPGKQDSTSEVTPPKDRLRASDRAYNQLCSLILELELKPAQVVDEQSLSTMIGIGRMPVREALARLAGERLVLVMPRRGMMIAPVGLDTVLEIFRAREAIECGNAYLAAQTITPQDLLTFRALVARTEEYRPPQNPGSYLDADSEVHAFLAATVRNVFLRDASDRIAKHNRRLWNLYFSARPPRPDSLVPHEPVLAALEAGDPDQAERAMREHILASRALLQQLF
jgi:DNA-binding GntR family transcriptional regulator